MEKLTLKTLVIRNFQSFDEIIVGFLPHETNISGDNGVGKTTIFSAYTWLLFGKDALMREKFDIKPYGSKKEDVEVICVLEHTTDHSKEEIELRRVLHEIWTDLGEYKGDETRCFINGILTKATEYKAYINTFASEKNFYILTYPNYFLSMDTKSQRDYLCKMAGEKDIKDVITGNKRLLEAYDRIPKGFSIDDFIKKIEGELKTLKDEKKGIQPAIDALISTMPKEIDDDDVKEEEARINKEIEHIDELLLSSESAIKEKVMERTAIYAKIGIAQRKVIELTKERDDKVRDLKDKDEKAINDAKTLQMIRVNNLKILTGVIESLESQIVSHEAKKDRLYGDLDTLMKECHKVNAEEFSSICPYAKVTCNHISSDSKEDFEAKKKERLEALMKEGKAKNIEYESVVSEIADLNEELTAKRKIADSKKAQIAEYVEPTYDTKAEQDKIILSYDKVIHETQEEINNLQSAYDAFKIEDNTDKGALMEARGVLQAKIKELHTLSAQSELRDSINAKIEEKRKEGVVVASKIVAHSELAEDLRSIKTMIIKDSAQRINDMFAITTWEVTELLKNGTYRDTCKPFVNGVSASLNTAMALNVRLDICQTISNYLGIRLPLFIDSRECCNKTIDLSMQIINLRVAPIGTPLTIN